MSQLRKVKGGFTVMGLQARYHDPGRYEVLLLIYIK